MNWQEPQHKAFELQNANSIAEGNGVVEGFGNTIYDIDRYGEIVLEYKGAEDFVKEGFISDTHGLSNGKMGNHTYSNTIGMPQEVRVDDKGFFVRFEFFADPDAQKIRTRVAQRIDAKKSVFLSIGYNITEQPIYIFPADYQRELPKYIPANKLEAAFKAAKNFQRLALIKVNVFEISIVPRPVNANSEITGMKALETDTNMNIEFTDTGFKAVYLGEDIESELSLAVIDRLYCRLNMMLCGLLYSELPDAPQTINASIDEFASMLKQIIAQFSAMEPMDTEGMKALHSDAEEFKASLAGNLLTGKAAFAIKAVENFKAAMSKEFNKVKDSEDYKAGRTLNASNEKKIGTVGSKAKEIGKMASEISDEADSLVASLYDSEDQKAMETSELYSEFLHSDFLISNLQGVN